MAFGRGWLLAVAALLVWASPALADSDKGRSNFGSDIVIPEGETTGDVACAFCSVTVHGMVNGDVAVAFGSVTVDDGKSISGDVAIMGGDLYLGREARVNGNLAIAAGEVKKGDNAMIGGSHAVLPGRGWLLVLLTPFLLLAGIVWLIIYFVRRNRYQFPAYPPPARRL